MDSNYRYNNSIVNYAMSISSLKKIFESYKIDNPPTTGTIYAIICCHIVSVLDVYIGDVIRYVVSHKEGRGCEKVR